ncbi:hypothetical protein N9P82_00370 [bacterium]|nr:hypothetical protein [bacterium]
MMMDLVFLGHTSFSRSNQQVNGDLTNLKVRGSITLTLSGKQMAEAILKIPTCIS